MKLRNVDKRVVSIHVSDAQIGRTDADSSGYFHGSSPLVGTLRTISHHSVPQDELQTLPVSVDGKHKIWPTKRQPLITAQCPQIVTSLRRFASGMLLVYRGYMQSVAAASLCFALLCFVNNTPRLRSCSHRVNRS